MALTTTACHDAPEEAPSPPPPPATRSWQFPLEVHPELPDYLVTLEADLGAAVNNTRGPVPTSRVLVRTRSTGDTVQAFDGVIADPPESALESGVAFQTLDMNFDGYRDFRLLALAPAGPNVRYLNWLYRAESATFSPSADHDALVAASYDAETREVTSTARETSGRYVTETYLPSGETLALKSRAVKEYIDPGRYKLTISEPDTRGMRIVEERVVDEPPN